MTDVFAFPASYYPDVQRLSPIAKQRVFESPYNAAQQVINFAGGEAWRLEMAFADLTGDARADMTAFFTRLRVSRNVFIMVNHTAPQRGSFQGSPIIDISSQTGTVFPVDVAGQANVSSWARQGDFCSVNCELKMILEDVGTSAGAVASLTIWPPLRRVPDSGTTVHVSSPAGAFRLVKEVMFNTQPPEYITDLSILAMEYISSSQVVNL